MARAETIETVAESGGGGGNATRHNACCMVLPRPLHAWPSLLTTTPSSTSTRAGVGATHPHHNPHNLDPFQALYQSYPLPYPQDETQTHPSPSPTAPLSPLCNRREESNRDTSAPGDSSEEQSDSDREENQSPSSRQGALPDLLPQNEHPSWAPSQAQAVQEMEIRRVANRLRLIGDEFNATVLRRALVAHHWRDWRGVCRGLLSFITQTLSTLYRLT
ncbi:bcl-2-binding component 3 [Odontesthes bonariensis]|uniref:bcl-2-binding component 3 n=1 Tax=Odontesthes bonariensis TaxID=219752 RepID=UPI003F5882BD